MLNFKRIQFGFLALLCIFVLGNIRSLAFAQGQCGPFPTLASDWTNGPQWDNSTIQIIIDGNQDENDLEADGTLLRGNCVDVKLDSSNWGHPIYHWTLSGTDFHFTTTTGPTEIWTRCWYVPVLRRVGLQQSRLLTQKTRLILIM